MRRPTRPTERPLNHYLRYLPPIAPSCCATPATSKCSSLSHHREHRLVPRSSCHQSPNARNTQCCPSHVLAGQPFPHWSVTYRPLAARAAVCPCAHDPVVSSGMPGFFLARTRCVRDTPSGCSLSLLLSAQCCLSQGLHVSALSVSIVSVVWCNELSRHWRTSVLCYGLQFEMNSMIALDR